MKTNTATYEVNEVDLKTKSKIQIEEQWNKKYQTELMERIMPKLSKDDLQWIKDKMLNREEEINKEFDAQCNSKEKSEKKKDINSKCIRNASTEEIKTVIAPLKGVTHTIIKSKDELALTFAFMYDGITQSHPLPIKSTPKNKDKTFNADKKKMIEWIDVIKLGDSDIEIHTVVPNTKPSDGITRPCSCNNHLPPDGWNNKYDILIKSLAELKLPPKPKTFYSKRGTWKEGLKAHGMGEKRRAKLVEAIIRYRVLMQKNLSDPKTHVKSMKVVEDWVKSIPSSIKSLAQKKYYF